jgi:hypothetical protein
VLSLFDPERSDMKFDLNREAAEADSFPLLELQSRRYVIRSTAKNKAGRAPAAQNSGNASGGLVF